MMCVSSIPSAFSALAIMSAACFCSVDSPIEATVRAIEQIRGRSNPCSVEVAIEVFSYQLGSTGSYGKNFEKNPAFGKACARRRSPPQRPKGAANCPKAGAAHRKSAQHETIFIDRILLLQASALRNKSLRRQSVGVCSSDVRCSTNCSADVNSPAMFDGRWMQSSSVRVSPRP